jgi:nucleoside-diphosphate-sugar epimerase
MKIAVTGTSGRIGRAIHFALCQEHDVVGIDRSVSSVTTHLGEIDNYQLLTKAFKGADAVIHVAALHAPHVGIYDDSEFYRANVEGTSKVFQAAADCGVKTLVFTSSTAVYGYASQHPDRAAWINETTIPQPKSIYHRTKLEAEQFLEAEASRNLKVTTLRMSRCFPEPAPTMAMYRLHRGIDARDVAEAHKLALIESEEDYRMLILSGTTPFSRADCKALKQTPEQVLQHKCPSICNLFASRQWELPESIDRVYDSSLAQRTLGWTPSYGFEDVAVLLDAHIPEVLPENAAENTISE